MMPPTRALTLWQPMAWAISDYTKRIENRPWKPWAIAKRIAIHAGKTYHADHAAQIEDVFGVVVPRGVPQGAIVAVVSVVDCVEQSDDPWFSGPFGWVLGDVVKLRHPVPAKGAQGLWRIPSAILAAVERQL